MFPSVFRYPLGSGPREDGSRVKYKKVCASCGKEVSGDGIVKGFEIEPGRYVTLTDDDFEKAKAEKDF